ncbi:hypothetical protein J1N35_029989 [Gossypium stocksii]|uniref:A20-type domain-containing protein n=1 Tax=Gossypium stocksii TaxID=47602 RepID=A0A9D3ZTQ4_9ROSI|nr:hypothetical protein J1N35_029989 [Gossypium stocksii]
MESHDETGCQAPEGPILCINNCGFFGSAATMNMYSKCHKAMILKQEQAQLAASSIGSIVNGGSTGNGKEPAMATTLDVQSGNADTKMISTELPIDPSGTTSCGMKMKKDLTASVKTSSVQLIITLTNMTALSITELLLAKILLKPTHNNIPTGITSGTSIFPLLLLLFLLLL